MDSKQCFFFALIHLCLPCNELFPTLQVYLQLRCPYCLLQHLKAEPGYIASNFIAGPSSHPAGRKSTSVLDDCPMHKFFVAAFSLPFYCQERQGKKHVSYPAIIMLEYCNLENRFVQGKKLNVGPFNSL